MSAYYGPEASFSWLPLAAIDPWLPRMEALGVSEVARSPRGFLAVYRRAGGDPAKLSPAWHQKRDNFLKRHMAQVIRRDELLVRADQPTRRHLALIAWAYSPLLF